MSRSPRSLRQLLPALTLAAGLAGCAARQATAPESPPRPAAVERDPWPPSGPVDGPRARALVARGALLVDVRTEESFTVERLPGAFSLPLEDLDQAKELFEQRSKPIVVYCGAGIQSAAAAKRLAEMGFTHVYDLGPMFGWRRER